MTAATLPQSISKTSGRFCDSYEGPLDDVLATGLIRQDQLPPPGQLKISRLDGNVITRRCSMNEGYLRIELIRGNRVLVVMGISAATARKRREEQCAKSERYRAECQARTVPQTKEEERERSERWYWALTPELRAAHDRGYGRPYYLVRQHHCPQAVKLPYSLKPPRPSHLRLVWSAPG